MNSNTHEVSFKVAFDSSGNVLYVERLVEGDWVKVTTEKQFPLDKSLGLKDMQSFQILLGDVDPCIVQHRKLICW